MSGIDEAATTMPVEPMSMTARCCLPPNDNPRSGGLCKLPYQALAQEAQINTATIGLVRRLRGAWRCSDRDRSQHRRRTDAGATPDQWTVDCHVCRPHLPRRPPILLLFLRRRVFAGELGRDRRELLAVPLKPRVARPGALEI